MVVGYALVGGQHEVGRIAGGQVDSLVGEDADHFGVDGDLHEVGGGVLDFGVDEGGVSEVEELFDVVDGDCHGVAIGGQHEGLLGDLGLRH